MTRATELDFCFSLLQTPVGQCAFENSISKLKQVTGCDHHAIQHYIVSIIVGSVLQHFLITIHSLVDFCYLDQVLVFIADLLVNIAKALQDFHDHKDAITQAGMQKDSWGIPKLELLQSVIPSICLSGAVT